MTPEQKRGIFGPEAQTPYKQGDTIQFIDPTTGQERAGELLYTTAPRISTGTGTIHQTQFWLDCGDGFPTCILESDIIPLGQKKQSD